MHSTKLIPLTDERMEMLRPDWRWWWDSTEKRCVRMGTFYVPQGCGDYALCTMCALPLAVEHIEAAYYAGARVPDGDNWQFFERHFDDQVDSETHTVVIFNAGSFLSDVTNPPELRALITRKVAEHRAVRRLVIEARAPLVTEQTVRGMTEILHPCNTELTVRIGIETKNEYLRNRVLRKGQGNHALQKALDVMKRYGVTSGAYVLLKPAAHPDLRICMQQEDATEAQINTWSMEETRATFDWLLNELSMDEVYFRSTSVAPSTPLETAWKYGCFTPASLWMVLKVLKDGAQQYPGRIHVLPFSDQPPFLAISSNTTPKGIPEDLTGASPEDQAFYEVLKHYRHTMDPSVLVPPSGTTPPTWWE